MPIIKSKNKLRNKRDLKDEKLSICKTDNQINFVNKFLNEFWFDCRIMKLFQKSLDENTELLHLEDPIKFYIEWKSYIKNLLNCRNAKEFTDEPLILNVVEDNAKQIAKLIYDFNSVVDIEDPLSLHLIYSYIDDIYNNINGLNFYSYFNIIFEGKPETLSLPQFAENPSELLRDELRNYPRRFRFLQEVKEKYQNEAKSHRLNLWDDLTLEKKSDVIRSIKISSFKRNGQIEFLGQVYDDRESFLINQIVADPNEEINLQKMNKKIQNRRGAISDTTEKTDMFLKLNDPNNQITSPYIQLGNQNISKTDFPHQGSQILLNSVIGIVICGFIIFLIYLLLKFFGLTKKIKPFFQRKNKKQIQEESSLNKNDEI